MIAIMQKALDARTPLEGRTDRLLQWFVPAIVLLALLTGLVCLGIGMTLEAAMVRAVTVLVISCPCALGVAIPLARVAGISVAGRHGILVREFSAFERAQQVDTLVFDKTGTVTDGRWRLLAVRPAGAMDPAYALRLAHSLEAGQSHFIAAAIRRKAEADGLGYLPLTDRRASADGISARLEGRPVRIGSARFAGGGTPPAEPGAGVDADSPKSRVYLSLDDRPAAVFEFGDSLRPAAADTLKALKRMGYALALISGDEEATTRRVARRLGIPAAAGGLRPHEKADYIQNLQERGARVAMVGDGVNDAPAMAMAQLAIAVHSGSQLSRETADITLMRGDPAQIMDFLGLGRQVGAKIRQNLACAFIYNLIAIPVAMSGLLTPLVAVCAMLLSSLTVIGNTLRLVRRAA
jgi:heavy metal translocating P-type ATPase